MKYFEIVFDNSSSMGLLLANSTRIKVAKDLFRDDILPLVSNDTQLAVRLLRNACLGHSEYQFFGNDVDGCASFINEIQTNGGTPLFNTIKDALHTTLPQPLAERTIFVLTDGADTCGNEIENVLTAEEINSIKQINVIIAQYAVSLASDMKKLSHLAKIIGAKTINFGNNSSASMIAIRSEFKLEIQKIGFNRNNDYNN